MMRYTIQHKHCGMITHIEGYTSYDAFKRSNKNPNLWNVIDWEEI